MTARLDLVDYHIHTARCGHARGEMAAYIEQAIRASLPEMGFSDHIFLYWLPADQRDPELAMSEGEFDQYVEDVLQLRAQYPDITIRLADPPRSISLVRHATFRGAAREHATIPASRTQSPRRPLRVTSVVSVPPSTTAVRAQYVAVPHRYAIGRRRYTLEPAYSDATYNPGR